MCWLLDAVKEVIIPKDRPKIGYRGWHVGGGGILTPMTSSYSPWRNKIAKADSVPKLDNRSGLYVLNNKSSGKNGHVYGTVKFWGRCVEHVNGYRAQFAEVVALEVPLDIWGDGENTERKLQQEFQKRQAAAARALGRKIRACYGKQHLDAHGTAVLAALKRHYQAATIRVTKK